ncbi:hypothetical protein LINGRAHAP2_LOCUS34364 [Linum grandiflorum]
MLLTLLLNTIVFFPSPLALRIDNPCGLRG